MTFLVHSGKTALFVRSSSKKGLVAHASVEEGVGGACVMVAAPWTLCLQLHALPHRHPLRHRSGTAQALHVAVLGSAVLSPATPPAPCCFRSTLRRLRQVRLLRKLMPGEGFYMNVLWCIIKAWKRCAVPAAIASCCHESICAFVASCPALTRY